MEQQDEVRRTGAIGWLVMAMMASLAPALLIGAGFAKMLNEVATDGSVGTLNVVGTGAFLALTGILYLLMRIWDGMESRR